MPVQRTQNRLRPFAPMAGDLAKGIAALQPEDEPMPRPPYAAGSPEAAEAGRRGGLRRAGQCRLARRLALGEAFTDPRFEPYARTARPFRSAYVKQLARDVGGGHCGPAPSSIVASAALQLAASRFAFEVLGDLALGSRLADASRANLLSAYELCALEAKARPKTPASYPWLVPATSNAATRSLPTAGEDTSEKKPPAEGNVGAANDQVDGPETGDP